MNGISIVKRLYPEKKEKTIKYAEGLKGIETVRDISGYRPIYGFCLRKKGGCGKNLFDGGLANVYDSQPITVAL